MRKKGLSKKMLLLGLTAIYLSMAAACNKGNDNPGSMASNKNDDKITGTDGTNGKDNNSLLDDVEDSLGDMADDAADSISDLARDLTGSTAPGPGPAAGIGTGMGTAAP